MLYKKIFCELKNYLKDKINVKLLQTKKNTVKNKKTALKNVFNKKKVLNKQTVLFVVFFLSGQFALRTALQKMFRFNIYIYSYATFQMYSLCGCKIKILKLKTNFTTITIVY